MYNERRADTSSYLKHPSHDGIGGTQRIPGTAWRVSDTLTILYSTGLQVVASNTLAGACISGEDPKKQRGSIMGAGRIIWQTIYYFGRQFFVVLRFCGVPA